MIELRERTKALARELNVDLASRAPARQGDPNGPPQPTLEHVRAFKLCQPINEKNWFRRWSRVCRGGCKKAPAMRRVGCGSYAPASFWENSRLM